MNSAIIVIDPQKGFTSLNGTLGKAFASTELTRIVEVVDNLAATLPVIARFAHTAVVTSEYKEHQFDPVRGGPLSRLCVPRLSRDCEINDVLATFPFEHRFVKSDSSAYSSDAFRNWIISEQDRGVHCFLIAGFLFEHCVLDTAMDLRASISKTNHVVVLSDLVASRASKYATNGPVEQTLRKLKDASVEIVSSDHCCSFN